MRRIALLVVFVFLAVTALSGYCSAGENCRPGLCDCGKCDRKCDFATKIGWGLVNLIMAPAELVKGLTCAPEEKGMAYDLPVGLGHGVYNMAKRLGYGIYEVAPFTGPCVDKYDPVGKECTSCDERNPWVTDRASAVKAAAMEKK